MFASSCSSCQHTERGKEGSRASDSARRRGGIHDGRRAATNERGEAQDVGCHPRRPRYGQSCRPGHPRHGPRPGSRGALRPRPRRRRAGNGRDAAKAADDGSSDGLRPRHAARYAPARYAATRYAATWSVSTETRNAAAGSLSAKTRDASSRSVSTKAGYAATKGTATTVVVRGGGGGIAGKRRGERRGTQKKKETLNQREIEREKNYGTTL